MPGRSAKHVKATGIIQFHAREHLSPENDTLYCTFHRREYLPQPGSSVVTSCQDAIAQWAKRHCTDLSLVPELGP
jgi:hypothetical protein